MFGEIANECGRVDLPEQPRRLAHGDRAGTERLDREPIAGELLGAGNEARDVGGVELDDLRNEQDLAGDAGIGERRFEPLVDDALVRGVLIDNDDPSRVCATM